MFVHGFSIPYQNAGRNFAVYLYLNDYSILGTLRGARFLPSIVGLMRQVTDQRLSGLRGMSNDHLLPKTSSRKPSARGGPRPWNPTKVEAFPLSRLLQRISTAWTRALLQAFLCALQRSLVCGSCILHEMV